MQAAHRYAAQSLLQPKYAGSGVFSISSFVARAAPPAVASTSAVLAVHADEVVLGTTRSKTSTFLEMSSLAIGYPYQVLRIYA